MIFRTYEDRATGQLVWPEPCLVTRNRRVRCAYLSSLGHSTGGSRLSDGQRRRRAFCERRSSSCQTWLRPDEPGGGLTAALGEWHASCLVIVAVFQPRNKTPRKGTRMAIRTWFPSASQRKGKIGYILLWLLGVPIPILLVIFLLRGCT